MRSVLIAITLLALFGFAIWSREARAKTWGDLYALCNPAFDPACNVRALERVADHVEGKE